jgi:hypothetical protein
MRNTQLVEVADAPWGQLPGPFGPTRTRGPAEVSTICSVTDPEYFPMPASVAARREQLGVETLPRRFADPDQPTGHRGHAGDAPPSPLGELANRTDRRDARRAQDLDQMIVGSLVVHGAIGPDRRAGALRDHLRGRRRIRIDPVDVLQVPLGDHDQNLAVGGDHRHQIGIRRVGRMMGGSFHCPIWLPVLRV